MCWEGSVVFLCMMGRIYGGDIEGETRGHQDSWRFCFVRFVAMVCLVSPVVSAASCHCLPALWEVCHEGAKSIPSCKERSCWQ